VIAALGYAFTPVVPAVVLLGDLKRDAALRLHAWQALLWAPVFLVLLAVVVVLEIWLLRADFLAVCLLPFLLLVPFIPGGIWALRAYQGQDVTIRLLSPIAERNARGTGNDPTPPDSGLAS
jgi:uncharacterized membrane protein